MKDRQFRYIGAILEPKFCDIYRQKAEKTRTSADLRFKLRTLKCAKVVEFRQFNETQVVAGFSITSPNSEPNYLEFSPQPHASQ